MPVQYPRRLLGLRELVLGLVLLARDPRLLALEQIEGDGLGVRHLQQLAPLLVEPCQPLLRPPDQLHPILTLAGQHLVQLPTYAVGVELVQPDPHWQGTANAVLQVEGRDVRQVAALALVPAVPSARIEN
jgi:hypothetical protein